MLLFISLRGRETSIVRENHWPDVLFFSFKICITFILQTFLKERPLGSGWKINYRGKKLEQADQLQANDSLGKRWKRPISIKTVWMESKLYFRN